jgi:hypothetical protein
MPEPPFDLSAFDLLFTDRPGGYRRGSDAVADADDAPRFPAQRWDDLEVKWRAFHNA